MSSSRWFASALLFFAAATILPATTDASAAVPTTLSGAVHDQLGRALAGAEILVLAPEGGGAAPAHAVTDIQGHFLIGSLTPGVYRVAAIKPGYVAALGRVNTFLKASVDLVLRPVPAPGEPGALDVQSDLSWTLRVPPRSILKDVDAGVLLASMDSKPPKSPDLSMPDSIRGEVQHVVALGAWRSGPEGPASALSGNETRMQFGGSLGRRGAIHVEGSHGSLDSSSGSSVSRAASDLDVDVSYETGDEGRLAMRAFFSTGDLEVGEMSGANAVRARQGQRSWGYEGQWKQQVGGASRVALQVGFHDASVDVNRGADAAWADFHDASNRALGAEGQFESLAGGGHLVRFGVRAQLMSLSAPTARIARTGGAFALEGTTGWSLLLDAEDQWTVQGPWAVTYGVAVRQGFDDTFTTTATPRVGASWAGGRFKASGELSYLAAASLSGDGLAASELESRSPVGYMVELEAPVTRTASIKGTAAYVPLRANVWSGVSGAPVLQDLYVSDGSTSDQFVALALERAAGVATVSFRVAQGTSEGALAPAMDDNVPVLILSSRTLRYQSMLVGVQAPRAGSTLNLEYRAIHEQPGGLPAPEQSLETIELGFAQQIARLASGRASCRLLLTARRALDPESGAIASESGELRRFASLYQRFGAGVSLAF